MGLSSYLVVNTQRSQAENQEQARALGAAARPILHKVPTNLVLPHTMTVASRCWKLQAVWDHLGSSIHSGHWVIKLQTEAGEWYKISDTTCERLPTSFGQNPVDSDGCSLVLYVTADDSAFSDLPVTGASTSGFSKEELARLEPLGSRLKVNKEAVLARLAPYTNMAYWTVRSDWIQWLAKGFSSTVFCSDIGEVERMVLTGDMDNTPLICPHGRLDPKRVDIGLRVSFDAVQSMARDRILPGDFHYLQDSDLCENCMVSHYADVRCRAFAADFRQLHNGHNGHPTRGVDEGYLLPQDWATLGKPTVPFTGSC